MKVRSGFVSNSSSSSFTIIMTPEQEKEWLEQLNCYEKQVIEADNGLSREEKEFNGNPVIVYSGYSGNYDTFDDVELELIEEDVELNDEEFYEKYGFVFSDGVYEVWNSAKDQLSRGVLEIEVDF